jgi:hypothetical protein
MKEAENYTDNSSSRVTNVTQLPGYLPRTYTIIPAVQISHWIATRRKTAQQINIPQIVTSSTFCVTCATEPIFGRFRVIEKKTPFFLVLLLLHRAFR